MVRLQYGLSTNGTTATIEMEPGATFSAADLEDFLRLLAVLRAAAKPPVPNENPTPQTLFSSIACIRWYMTIDPDAPTQIRLYLLHPGFGWIWIPLGEEAVTQMTSSMQQLLQSRPKLQ